MPPRTARCSQGRSVDRIMHEDSPEAVISEQFSHAASCYACRLEMVTRRDYPPGCNAPYLGHQAMNYLILLTLSQFTPKKEEEGVIGMRELLREHKDALKTAGVAAELVDHVIDCTACVLDILTGREGLRQMHRRPAAAPQTEF